MLSLLFGLLALAGFGLSVIDLKKAHSSTVMVTFDFAYGLTALASAIGLWKFKPWAYQAVMSWSVTVLLIMLIRQFGLYGIYAIPLLEFSAFALFSVGLFVLLLFYVKKQVIR